jgi:hypothetical protein
MPSLNAGASKLEAQEPMADERNENPAEQVLYEAGI